jgi:hypothetical protein
MVVERLDACFVTGGGEVFAIGIGLGKVGVGGRR